MLAPLAQALKVSPSAASRREAASRKLVEACVCSEDAALALTRSGRDGLSPEEAGLRLADVGPNALARAQRHGVLADLFSRVRDPLVIQLVIICAVSFAMGDVRSGVVVTCMIAISVLLAAVQERRSGRAAEELQKLVQTTCMVLRGGRETPLPMEQIVPGDVVVLAAGSIVPADARVIAAKDFFVSQSSLTGESMPLEKSAAAAPAGADALALPNACFQGSTVLSGASRAVVVNTGLSTVLGAVSLEVSAAKQSTSFDLGVKSFVWLMVRFMVVMVSLTFLIAGITKHDWMQALLFALSVAVGLTPEMLPMIMTVCLSKGALAMARKRVIVKKLKAIQNFGAMNILCTDKTGTLTQDRIVLERFVDVTSRHSEDVLRYAYMNSYYQTGLRNLLDRAILAHEELDVERSCRKVDEIPFDFSRRRMSVVIENEGTHVLICKGAVEEVFAACDRYQIDDDIYPLIDAIRNDVMEEYQELSAQGYRILAVAYREFGREREVFGAADESGLTLLGYLAFFDPPKESAAAAIAALRASGVAVKILTGDNELVTAKVCRDVSFAVGMLVTGPQLAAMSDEELRRTAVQADVFARLSPMQKERIIAALRSEGNVVGFLGDGINDAPALKRADVGISVDSAVDVAKESADIILLERSLMVLRDGVIEGRRVFANIIKYIKMGASSNFGNMFSVVGGSAFLPFLPMAPVQVLVNNLLYDISQTGIPTDAVDEEFVSRPQRWDMRFIRRFMTVIGPISSLFDYATFFLMLYAFNCILFVKTADAGLRAHSEALFHTGWFVESLLTQTLIVHIIRTNRVPFIQSVASPALVFTTLAVMASAVALPYSPLAPYLGLVPLPASFWPWMALFLGAYGILTHGVKVWFNRRWGASS